MACNPIVSACILDAAKFLDVSGNVVPCVDIRPCVYGVPVSALADPTLSAFQSPDFTDWVAPLSVPKPPSSVVREQVPQDSALEQTKEKQQTPQKESLQKLAVNRKKALERRKKAQEQANKAPAAAPQQEQKGVEIKFDPPATQDS